MRSCDGEPSVGVQIMAAKKTMRRSAKKTKATKKKAIKKARPARKAKKQAAPKRKRARGVDDWC
jgi:hypothetical protein